MMDKVTSEAELHAKWVASQDIARFQSLLNSETEDGKYNLLAQLLSLELALLLGKRSRICVYRDGSLRLRGNTPSYDEQFTALPTERP